MVTITLNCPHCQSDALVRNGHAPNGKQLYRCRSCGRQSRENPTRHAYPQARREEILHAYQERSSLRGLTRMFGVSRIIVSTWIKKSSSASPPSARPLSSPIQEMPLPPRWSSMSCGRLCSKKSTRSGCGLPCVARRVKWLPMRWGIGANRHANVRGKPSHQPIARDIALPTFGRHTRR